MHTPCEGPPVFCEVRVLQPLGISPFVSMDCCEQRAKKGRVSETLAEILGRDEGLPNSGIRVVHHLPACCEFRAVFKQGLPQKLKRRQVIAYGCRGPAYQHPPRLTPE